MNFGNTKDVKSILENIHELVMSVAIEEKKSNEALRNLEDIQQDYLHEIELAPLNAIELMQVAQKIKRIRRERRKVKDTLEYISILKIYTKKFIEKGILSDTDQVIKNIDAHSQKLDNRKYTPRVIKDLKCVSTIEKIN